MHFLNGWGMGFGGGIFMVLFWILVIAGIVYIVKLLMGGSKDVKESGSALDILKKRYARGEINREEFEEMKKDLEA
jgi:putative membrane protein